VEGRVSGPPSEAATTVSKDPVRIAGMFDAIARRYDTLNHLLSAGFDRRWRRRAVRSLAFTGRERVVDVCTGTGDLAIEAATARGGHAGRIIGLDFSAEMLRLAKQKLRAAALSSHVHMARADATHLPLADRSMDAATVAFGIRNVLDPARACEELYRVLVPGGQVAILEFGAPAAPALRAVYLWYFRRVLPLIGRMISKHRDAYSYLPLSVLNFPAGEAFGDVLRARGFTRVRCEPLTFGIVWLYLASRPPDVPGGSGV
jgi:demethylmenaquinone methyltransferase / 2-methoxy-6-polyprenyl-1,4-benzoquinol methylase